MLVFNIYGSYPIFLSRATIQAMSTSLSAPWIKPTVLKLLSDDPKGNFRTQFLTRKAVQVTRIYSELNVLEISDKNSHIGVVLTSATMKHLQSQDAFTSLDGLRNSVVKIQGWHVSTVAQCIDAKNVKKAVQMGITMPFAIQCDKIDLLGADDCVVFGSPTDINKDVDVRHVLSSLTYAALLQQFVAVQFPGEISLPNSEGQFCVRYLGEVRAERPGAAAVAGGAPTPVARRTRSAPSDAAKKDKTTRKAAPAPADRRAKPRVAGSSAPEEEDPFLLCLEDCIIPADQAKQLLRESVIFRQRDDVAAAPPSVTPVARRTRGKQVQPAPVADTQVDDMTLESTQAETQAATQAPLLATQVTDDVSGLEYVITQQVDACAVVPLAQGGGSQPPGLSSQDVLFGPSDWTDPLSSSSGASGGSLTIAQTIASTQLPASPAANAGAGSSVNAAVQKTTAAGNAAVTKSPVPNKAAVLKSPAAVAMPPAPVRKSPVPTAKPVKGASMSKSPPAQTQVDDDDFEEMTQKQYPQHQTRAKAAAAVESPPRANVAKREEEEEEDEEEDEAPPAKRPKKTKVGRRVSKYFGTQYGHCQGVVKSFSSETTYYLIEYEDGDTEEMTERELCKYLIPNLLC